MKASAIPGIPEHQCYAAATKMREVLGKRPNHAATDNFLSNRVTKPIALQPYHIRMIARFYFKTFAVEPFGEKVRIHLR